MIPPITDWKPPKGARRAIREALKNPRDPYVLKPGEEFRVDITPPPHVAGSDVCPPSVLPFRLTTWLKGDWRWPRLWRRRARVRRCADQRIRFPLLFRLRGRARRRP